MYKFVKLVYIRYKLENTSAVSNGIEYKLWIRKKEYIKSWPGYAYKFMPKKNSSGTCVK